MVNGYKDSSKVEIESQDPSVFPLQIASKPYQEQDVQAVRPNVSPVATKSLVTGESVCSCCGTFLDPDFPHECGNDLLYLEQYNCIGGGASEVDENKDHFWHEQTVKKGKKQRSLKEELEIVSACGKQLVELWGGTTLQEYFKRLYCNKFYCPVCGGEGGRLHNKRKAAVYRRLEGIKEKIMLRQFVFTVPEQYRARVMSWKDLSALEGAAVRIVRASFPERGLIINIHLFGDDDPGVFKPHINIDLVENRTAIWMLSAIELEKINKKWLRALQAYFKDYALKEVVTHYRFKASDESVGHEIKYMTRPVGFNHINIMTNEMKKFLIVDLKGFQYLRFGGTMANNKYRDDCIKEDIANDEKVIGERLIFKGIITISEFQARYRDKDLEVIGDGLYRVRKVEKKQNLKERKKL